MRSAQSGWPQELDLCFVPHAADCRVRSCDEFATSASRRPARGHSLPLATRQLAQMQLQFIACLAHCSLYRGHGAQSIEQTIVVDEAVVARDSDGHTCLI